MTLDLRLQPGRTYFCNFYTFFLVSENYPFNYFRDRKIRMGFSVWRLPFFNIFIRFDCLTTKETSHDVSFSNFLASLKTPWISTGHQWLSMWSRHRRKGWKLHFNSYLLSMRSKALMQFRFLLRFFLASSSVVMCCNENISPFYVIFYYCAL